MGTLDPRDRSEGHNNDDKAAYDMQVSILKESVSKLPMSTQFMLHGEFGKIDRMGVNPETGRHEMTDLDVWNLKLLYKQLMLLNVSQQKFFQKELMLLNVSQQKSFQNTLKAEGDLNPDL